MGTTSFQSTCNVFVCLLLQKVKFHIVDGKKVLGTLGLSSP